MRLAKAEAMDQSGSSSCLPAMDHPSPSDGNPPASPRCHCLPDVIMSWGSLDVPSVFWSCSSQVWMSEWGKELQVSRIQGQRGWQKVPTKWLWNTMYQEWTGSNLLQDWEQEQKIKWYLTAKEIKHAQNLSSIWPNRKVQVFLPSGWLRAPVILVRGRGPKI